MNKNNKKMDATSIVMIVVFTLLVVAAAVFVAVKWLSVDNTPEIVETPVVEETPEVPQKVLYDKPTDLADKFLEVCKAGDIDALYDLYYDDYLTKMRENMPEVPTKEEFDKNIKAEMQNIVGFDEYEYGSPELPPTSSPAAYTSYIYYQANNEKECPLTSSDVTDCVNLVVYINGGYQTNHFIAEIGGYWYFIV